MGKMDSDTLRWINIDIDPGRSSDVRETLGDRSEPDQPTTADRVDHPRDTAQVTIIHPEHCSDDSVHGNTAPVQIARFTLPKDPWQLGTAILLALSILVNVALFMAYRHTEQTVDLDRYDDNTFINGRFSDLVAQVKADHELIQAYGLQKAVKEK
jgi:hypothetical protein